MKKCKIVCTKGYLHIYHFYNTFYSTTKLLFYIGTKPFFSFYKIDYKIFITLTIDNIYHKKIGWNNSIFKCIFRESESQFNLIILIRKKLIKMELILKNKKYKKITI